MSSSFKSSAGSLPKRSEQQQQSKTSKPAAITKPSTTTAPKTKTTTTSTNTASNSSSAVPKQAQEPQPPQQQPQQQPQATQPQSQAQGGEDAAVYVRSLLEEMQGRFDAMSKQIISKIDSVGSNVDALDAEITELMREAGVGNASGEDEQQDEKTELGQAAGGDGLEETTTVGKVAAMLGQEPMTE
jgi:heat shock factor-binding protein 1